MRALVCSRRSLAHVLMLSILMGTAEVAAQVGTWSIEGVQRGGCRPPLAPCPNRFFDRFRNTLSLHEDGTYRVPRDATCEYTGAVVAEEFTGSWRREGSKTLILDEANTVDYFSACYDLAVTIRRRLYKIRLIGASRFRAKIRVVGTVSRGGRSSSYREKEDFRGALVSAVSLTASPAGTSGGGGAGSEMRP